MRQKLRRRRGDSDDSAQREPAGTAGKTAASGADRALTAGAPERGAPDRIWHSPAAGLPTPAASGDGNRSSSGETGEPAKPETGGTYRVLTDEVAAALATPGTGSTGEEAAEDTAALDGPKTDGTGEEAAEDTAALDGPGTDGTGRRGSEETAALSTPGSGGTGRPANGDTAALSRPAVSSREPRPAVGDIAGRAGRAMGTETTAGDGAVPAQAGGAPAQGAAARQGNGGAVRMPRTAPSGSHEPLIGDAAALRANWRRVQGDFVDDPRAAVSNAADLVEHTAQALVGALRQRQQELRGLWDETLAGDAGEARGGGWLAGGRARRGTPGGRDDGGRRPAGG